MDTMNDRYNLHKEKLEMFSSAEIMEALNEFFSNPNWRDEKRFVITSKFGVTRDYGIGFKRVDLAADWAIDSAIRYLREEFGIFYAPDTVDNDDEYRKQDIKCTNDCYTSQLEKEVHNECVRADYWFKTARARLDEIEKLKKDRRQHAKDDMDYILTAFREVLDALGIDKSEYVAMDIPSLKRYAISEAEKAASNLDNYREGAVKFAKDYSALQDEKEKLEKDLKHMTDWNADLEKTLMRSKENLIDILEALGISRSMSIGQPMEFLRRHALQRASLLKSEHDKLLKTIDASKAINDARYERLNDLAIKISRMYSKMFNPGLNETCACTAERQLEAIESYVNELRTHNEALRKDVNSWIAKCNNLRIRCNSIFGKDGFIAKAKINDLCDEYDIVRPGDNEDCEASLRYILDILKEYRDRCTKSEDEVVRLLKDMTKDANDRKEKYDDLMKTYETEHEKVQEMSKAAAYVDTCIIDLYKRVFNSAPQKMFTDEMLKRIGYAYEKSLDRGTFAGNVYTLICDYCDRYKVKKPSSDLTLEESIADIVKRFAATLKENQDFRYEVEKLCIDMTDLRPGVQMTILDILKEISEEVDNRESEYCKMEEQWAKADALRKEWCRKYESEHERANGEHKKADRYWAQVAGLQTRIKNLEDALNRSASNATGYEALKNTLRKTLDSEARLKFERDALADELHKAKDAIRKQNEAILRKERLDEASDCDTEE